MKKKLNLIILFFLFHYQATTSQQINSLLFSIGPSLTNAQEIINGEKIFYINPQRPFYSIQYHLGASIESKLLKNDNLRISYGLSYDQRGSSNTGFNKKAEVIFGFLGVPTNLVFYPVKNKNICFEIGANFLYLIYRPIYAEPSPFKSFQFDYSIGMRFKVLNSYGISIKFLEPLLIMNGSSNIANNNPSLIEKRKYKTHSIQLGFNYTIKL